ncbi:MAG: helix-turn-helix domain-containing protein, partial [Betaproteobacteria bacterium]
AACSFRPLVSDMAKRKTEPLSVDGKPANTAVSSLASLGSIVRAQRRASGLRIDDAAALCGVSVDLLSRLENGRSGVATDRVLKVLDALGLAMIVTDKEKLPLLQSALRARDDAGKQ